MKIHCFSKVVVFLIKHLQVVPVSDNSASVEFTVSNEEHIQMRLYRKEELGLSR